MMSFVARDAELGGLLAKFLQYKREYHSSMVEQVGALDILPPFLILEYPRDTRIYPQKGHNLLTAVLVLSLCIIPAFMLIKDQHLSCSFGFGYHLSC